MARKPHNYAHFQNLVNELKEQNAGNIASLQSHLEIQTDVLQSMKGFMLKGLQADQADLRKEREKELEGKKDKRKSLNMKSKLDMPRFSGKGFMGMLGNFLSTALLGIPGGLRRFMPRALGLALLPKLARGVALMVAGPSLIKALQAGFDQKTFSGGVEAFINSYFSPSGGAYTSLAEAAAGGAGKGALIGFGLLGPRGAIIGGLLGGALTGLNHVFAEDKSKMDSAGVMTALKSHLMENLTKYIGGAGAFLGAKTFMALGPAGMIAGGLLGAGIGIIGAGTIKEMMKVEQAGEKDIGKAFRQGLKNYLVSEEFAPVAKLMPYGAGLFGAAAFAGFGPAGMLAGMILGAGAGIIGGPVLVEALKAQGTEGGALADHMKTALWKYLKNSPYIQKALFGAGLFGIAGMMGLGPLGLVAGIFVGGIVGIIAQWITETLGDLAGATFKKAFGVEKILSPAEKAFEEAKKKHGRRGSYTHDLLSAKAPGHLMRIGSGLTKGVDDAFTVMQRLKEEYLKITGTPWLTGKFDPVAAQEAGHLVHSSGKYKKKDDWERLKAETQGIRLLQMRDRLEEAKRQSSRPDTGSIGSIMQDQSVQNVDVNYFTEGQMDYLNMNTGIIDRIS